MPGVNAVETEEESTALHYAAAKGHVDVVSVLLQNGASMNDTDPFHNMLHKTNRVTRKKDWMQLFSNACIFYDFWCQRIHHIVRNSNEI